MDPQCLVKVQCQQHHMMYLWCDHQHHAIGGVMWPGEQLSVTTITVTRAVILTRQMLTGFLSMYFEGLIAVKVHHLLYTSNVVTRGIN